MEAFPSEEHAKELKDPSFTFLVSEEEKSPIGVFSTVNSIFNLLGFAGPITIQGKAVVRELCTEHYEWDAPIPTEKETQCKPGKDSLKALEQLHIPRPYLPCFLALHATQGTMCLL
ncbi:hypothetical protein L3Q82_017661 [Scortum barcoo]|uniref:Uncharacterized protein n=1 Tax=Scortum barcoo TaxID=214431 RepID=A0ACB8VLN5_9TELE|nr:hypothetical protein L3Q82_017661 [Scortum barcoo]